MDETGDVPLPGDAVGGRQLRTITDEQQAGRHALANAVEHVDHRVDALHGRKFEMWVTTRAFRSSPVNRRRSAPASMRL